MKAKDLIKALKALNPESEVVINIKQTNKIYGVVQLPISWVNGDYSGSITVHLPDKAYICGLKKS